MAQMVSRRPPTTEAVHVGFVVDKVVLGQVFPCQFHSTGAPLKWKIRKNLIIFIIFLIGLHNKPSRLRRVKDPFLGVIYTGRDLSYVK
jgi:hypothetical protein